MGEILHMTFSNAVSWIQTCHYILNKNTKQKSKQKQNKQQQKQQQQQQKHH